MTQWYSEMWSFSTPRKCICQAGMRTLTRLDLSLSKEGQRAGSRPRHRVTFSILPRKSSLAKARLGGQVRSGRRLSVKPTRARQERAAAVVRKKNPQQLILPQTLPAVATANSLRASAICTWRAPPDDATRLRRPATAPARPRAGGCRRRWAVSGWVVSRSGLRVGQREGFVFKQQRLFAWMPA